MAGRPDGTLDANPSPSGIARPPRIVGPFWATLTRSGRTLRVSIPSAVQRRWPWIRRVKMAFIYAEEREDGVYVVVRLPAPPRVLGPRARRRWVNFLRFEFNARSFEELLRAAERVHELDDHEQQLLRETYLSMLAMREVV